MCQCIECVGDKPEPTTRELLAERLHYPECWDTAAYPTLEDALWEMCDTVFQCQTCGKPRHGL